MDTVTSRKRTPSSSQSGSDVPSAKKKKLASKEKEATRPTKRPSTSLPTPPSTTPADEVATGTGHQSVVVEDTAEGSASQGKKKPSPKLQKNRYLKPQPHSRGSWKTHVASLVIHRCVQQANSCGLDPRGHLSKINWSQMLDGLLRPDDLHLIWYFIRREYEERPLPDILESTQPYSDLTIDSLLREEIRVKYKGAIPKVPLSPYMIFMQAKHPKLKRKYPKLPMNEVAVKIGKKWKALPEEKKEKYKQQHAMLKAEYKTQLKSFYEEHPDAVLPPKQQTVSKSKKNATPAEEETEEEKRIKMLKAQHPKQSLSAYLHFCKKKREKLHRKHPDMPPNAVTVKLGKRWKSMDQEARGKYVALHEADLLRYKKSLEQFHSEHPDAQELLAKARKNRRKLKTKQSSAVSVQMKQPVTSSPPLTLTSPPPTLTTLPPTSHTVTTADVEEGEEEGEEQAAVLNSVQQNGDVAAVEAADDSTDSESETSDSSSED